MGDFTLDEVEVRVHKPRTADLFGADLLAYRQSLQHLAGSSQKRYLETIKSFFAWALDAGIIPTNPAASLKLPRAIGSRAPVF
jgi:site-specific recombinase XerD